jgi:hypothetical protein
MRFDIKEIVLLNQFLLTYLSFFVIVLLTIIAGDGA